MTQLQYRKINRKCVQYRHERVQRIVLNGSVWHYLTWHQPYCSRYSYIPKIPVIFNTNAKNAKNEDFLISSIISTAVNFKVLCCFLICYGVLSWHAVKSDSKHVFSNVRHSYCVFCINYQKIIINCVMTNKMVWNKCRSPFKNVHII